MSFIEVLERNLPFLGIYLERGIDGRELERVDAVTKGYAPYKIPASRVLIGDGARARMAYEVAERAEQDGFCDLLEPTGLDQNQSTAVGVKTGVNIKDWVYMPFDPFNACFHLFEPPGYGGGGLIFPTSEADLGILDSVHHALYPVYRSQTYLDMCAAHGIKPEHIIVPNAVEFWRNFLKGKLEDLGLDPNLPLADQVMSCDLEHMTAALLRNFGHSFLGYTSQTYLYDRQKSYPYEPRLFEHVNPASGEIKIEKLRTDPEYRKDAKVFSVMQMEKAIDSLEIHKDKVLEDMEMSANHAMKKYNPKPDLQDPEEIFNAIKELFRQYQNEMMSVKRD